MKTETTTIWMVVYKDIKNPSNVKITEHYTTLQGAKAKIKEDYDLKDIHFDDSHSDMIWIDTFSESIQYKYKGFTKSLYVPYYITTVELYKVN